jgi:putative sigma-54 modulation protein
MNLQISGHHIEVTPALRDYVQNRLDPVVRHFDRVTGVSVILSVEKLAQKAEVTLHVPGKDIFAENTGDDLYAAIDVLFDKLDRQVQKYKQKVQDHHRGDKAVHHMAEE